MTYAELLIQLQDYLESREPTFVSMIPSFVRQAESRIYRAILLPEFRKNVVLALTPSNAKLARPADFLGMFSIAVIGADGAYSYLIDKDMNFIREAYPNPNTTGTPRYYAQFVGSGPSAPTGEFLLAPTPATALSVDLQYYYDPPSIVDTDDSWLGTNAAPALLYGALVEAYTFLKGDEELMARYRARYDEAMAQLGVIDVRSKRDSYRDGDMRVE